MARHRMRLGWIGALAITSLAACGDNGSTDTSAAPEAASPQQISPVNATAEQAATTRQAKDVAVCDLITLAALEDAFGHAFISGGRTALSGIHPAWGCAHSSAPGAHPGGEDFFTTVSVQVSTWPKADDLALYIASMTEAGMFTLQDTQAIGQVAYWNGLVMGHDGDMMITVRISGDHGLDETALQERAITLTAAAIDALP